MSSSPKLKLKQLRLICEYHAEQRYGTPSHTGYMPFAFAAAHRLARTAMESSPAGYTVFSFNEDCTCNGCIAVHEEEETIEDVVDLRIMSSRSGRYLSLTATQATLLEEYLPKARWWLAQRAQSPGLQLALREGASMQRDDMEGITEQFEARRRAYDALAISNVMSLLSSLDPAHAGEWGEEAGVERPRTGKPPALEALKLVSFAMPPMLWESIVKAGHSLRVLNLAGVHDFTNSLVLEEMRKVLTPGCLEELAALVLPATDINEEVLRALLLAAPHLKYLNLGETEVKEITPIVVQKETLRRLFLYNMEHLDPSAMEVIGRCRRLDRLALTKNAKVVTSEHAVSCLGQLEHLTQLDLQGCDGFTSLEGLQKCTKMRRLLLTGCTALRDLRALSAMHELEELQAGNLPQLMSEAVDLSEATSLRVLSFAACAALGDVPGLSALSKVQLVDLSYTRATAKSLAALSTAVAESNSEEAIARLLSNQSGQAGGASSTSSDGAKRGTAANPAHWQGLHTLVLNECRGITDYKELKLPLLRRLSLAGTAITSADLEVIARECRKLEVLNLNYCEALTTFSVLKLFPALRALSLAFTKLSNNALQHVVQIPFLQLLSIQNSQVNDLSKLSKMPYLRVVQCASSNYRNANALQKANVSVEMVPAPPRGPQVAYAAS